MLVDDIKRFSVNNNWYLLFSFSIFIVINLMYFNEIGYRFVVLFFSALVYFYSLGEMNSGKAISYLGGIGLFCFWFFISFLFFVSYLYWKKIRFFERSGIVRKYNLVFNIASVFFISQPFLAILSLVYSFLSMGIG